MATLNFKNKTIHIIPILLLTCTLLALCINHNTTETTTTTQTTTTQETNTTVEQMTTTTIKQTTDSRLIKMRAPGSISLSIVGTPNLNQTVELVTTAEINHHYPDYSYMYTINVTLPEGVELVSGDTTWEGNLSLDKPQEIRAKIKAVKPGNWTIVGKLSGIMGVAPGTIVGSTTIVFLNNTHAKVVAYLPPSLSRDEDPVGTSIDPFWIKLSLSVLGAPKLNQTVELVTTIKPTNNPGNFTLSIGLPEGVELVSGNTTWRGNIDKDETKEIRLKLNMVKAGNWNISAQLSCKDRRHTSESYTNIPIIIPGATNATVID